MFSRSRSRRKPEPRPARGKKRISYRESSSDENSEFGDSQEEGIPLPPPAKKQKTVVPAKPSPKKRPSPAKKKSLGAPRKANSAANQPIRPQAQPRIESDGVSPDWASLPYEILLSIFRYAAQPNRSEEFVSNDTQGFLLNAAKLCKAFTEPALAALYESPPLVWTDSAHRLLACLSSHGSSPLINYKRKIKQLDFDVSRSGLANSVPGHGLLSLAALLRETPNIDSLRIYTRQDRAPFRTLRQVRWVYPWEMFDALAHAGCKLTEFRWNGTLLQGVERRIRQVHESAPFERLRHLAISHMEVVSESTSRPGTSRTKFDVDVLVPLQHLASLSIESCSSVDWPIFASLPSNLKALTIINCPSLTSEPLQSFLSSAGRSLEHLVLDHNNGLDLQFLPELKTSCPRLTLLKMDLTYFSSLTVTQSNAVPLYDQLLHDAQIPTWPSTMQTIELLHLRNWTSDAASVFFQSLVDTASELPHLRTLIIKAMLDISWRDRAKFRDTWISRLEKVFLRKPKPPRPELASARMFREWKAQRAPPLPPPPPSTQAPQAQQKADEQDSHGEGGDSSSAEPKDAQIRRSTRIYDAAVAHAHASTQTLDLGTNADKDPSTQSSSEADEAKQQPDRKRRQNLCTTVDVSIDNLRPSETRFNEADFLDTEASGDEEWTGRDRGVQWDGLVRLR